MKLFTITEANEILPGVSADLTTIQKLYAKLELYRDSARAAAGKSEAGGGMRGGSNYVKALYEIGKMTTALNDLGVQLKDYSKGLIDFPCMREGRVVLLCWQLGEGEKIKWWHELETGFGGRQLL
ncbi:MAG: DUF2203 domain-containing protein [Pyrinomonadaceae bacterium]|nr:DUF2203 domain-containing protein [Blastocatellia bacterium]MDQ3221370.1 DUF2203 domain-containing protein [Acidobacteriota bacterium]MDQ3490579.1 DUF2203 domain-containing protein [Acidobacteriota bacterium]